MSKQFTQHTMEMKKTKVKVLFSSLEKNEKIIWNFLNSIQRCHTHEHIRTVLKSTGIGTFDNRLRSLYKKGWVTKKTGPDDIILWCAVPKESEKVKPTSKPKNALCSWCNQFEVKDRWCYAKQVEINDWTIPRRCTRYEGPTYEKNKLKAVL